MMMLSVHLLALASAFVPVPVAQPAVEYYVYEPATQQFLGRADVVMSTQYGDPAVRAYKKKDPKTGSTKGLFGYTVGSRAPPRAVKSGERAQFGYGIDNRDGGRARLTQEKNSKTTGPIGPILLFLTVATLFAAVAK